MPVLWLRRNTVRTTKLFHGFSASALTAPAYMISGEVYVLNDGGEVDLDLGNYERYLDVTLSRHNNVTTGKIYREVIEKEVRTRHLTVHSVMAWVPNLSPLSSATRRLLGQNSSSNTHTKTSNFISQECPIDCSAHHKCDTGLDRTSI